MSLVATLMQSLRAQYPNNFDKNERRQSGYGAWEFFMQDSNAPGGIFSPDLKAKIKRSFGNTVTVPVLNAENVTISNTRSCTIADSENTSALVTLTFATYSFGFTMTPAQHYNNDIAYQADFDVKMRKYLLQLASDLDSQAIATLEAAKNAYAGTLGNYYTFSGGALQVSQAQKNDYYNTLEAIFRTMDFRDRIHVITNPNGMPLVKRLQNQGAGNSNNEEFQMSGYTWHETNRIANAGGIQSTQYAVQQGSVAMETRLDPDAIAGSKIADIKEWGRIVLPIVGVEAGTFYTKDCSDRSVLHAGTTGLDRTLLEGFHFSFDLVLATAYNSNTATRYQPILKTEISNS